MKMSDHIHPHLILTVTLIFALTLTRRPHPSTAKYALPLMYCMRISQPPRSRPVVSRDHTQWCHCQSLFGAVARHRHAAARMESGVLLRRVGRRVRGQCSKQARGQGSISDFLPC